MYTKSKYLLPGCTRPNDADLDRFYSQVKKCCPTIELPEDYQVRWIGADSESTRNILNHIRTGDKIGTVSVPMATEHNGQQLPAVGNAIILINFDGTPAMLVRISHLELVAYKNITGQHTALDGPAVRPMDIWIPLHRRYFDFLLEPCGKRCDDETIIAFETIEIIFDVETR